MALKKATRVILPIFPPYETKLRASSFEFAEL
jgi:hypothetical protein